MFSSIVPENFWRTAAKNVSLTGKISIENDWYIFKSNDGLNKMAFWCTDHSTGNPPALAVIIENDSQWGCWLNSLKDFVNKDCDITINLEKSDSISENMKLTAYTITDASQPIVPNTTSGFFGFIKDHLLITGGILVWLIMGRGHRHHES